MTRLWAVVPCRSGSKGLPGKNIRPLAGVPLIGHAIAFAQATGLFEQVLVSTESEEYAAIGRDLGGWVPFLRAASAAQDRSMEEDILADLVEKCAQHGITPPDALVWLRPVFPFRSIADLREAVELLDPTLDSVRLVTEGEPRLYHEEDGLLVPGFDDQGRSMLRRQEFRASFRVFHTDIFWWRNIARGVRFLGDRVKGRVVHKICGVDVDSVEDFEVAEAMMASGTDFIRRYSVIADRLAAGRS